MAAGLAPVVLTEGFDFVADTVEIFLNQIQDNFVEKDRAKALLPH